jgi:hypothetical protein
MAGARLPSLAPRKQSRPAWSCGWPGRLGNYRVAGVLAIVYAAWLGLHCYQVRRPRTLGAAGRGARLTRPAGCRRRSAAGRDLDHVALDIEATLVEAHAETEGASANFKSGRVPPRHHRSAEIRTCPRLWECGVVEDGTVMQSGVAVRDGRRVVAASCGFDLRAGLRFAWYAVQFPSDCPWHSCRYSHVLSHTRHFGASV